MLPNFIVIGAAKAGTTALYWYLADHPQVFMTSMKETNFFAYGLDDKGKLLYGDPELHHFPVRSLRQYKLLFEDADDATAIGEASPIYLECPQAARRIARLIPDGKIICGLRDPVDRAYSDYLMYLRSRERRLEPEADLIPTAAWTQPYSHWMQIGLYHSLLSRYYEVFPSEQIHVFLFDDLRKNSREVMQNIYRFLGVDSSFDPDFETPHNVGGVPASMLLERVLTNSHVKATLEPLLPRWASDGVRRFRGRTMRKAQSLPPELRQNLVHHFRDDIAKTSDLIGRSLEHWL
jgi:hypothetical protein